MGCYNIEDIYHAGVSAFPKLSSGVFTGYTEKHAVLYAAYKNDEDYHDELNSQSMQNWRRFDHKELAYYAEETDYNNSTISPIYCREKYFHLLNAAFVRSANYNVPDRVKKTEDGNEVYHYVVGIGRKAFADNHYVSKIHLSNKILTIEGKAFTNCSNLKSFEVVYGSPIKFASNLTSDDQPFWGVNFDKVILYIPTGTKYSYERANEWKKFKNIEEGRWAPQYWDIPDDANDNDHKHHVDDGGSPTEFTPYVVYNDTTLTFYYDDEQSSRQGTKYFLKEDNNLPAWSSINENVTKAVFDISFEDFLPTSTAFWFNNFKSLKVIEGLEYLNTSNVTDMSCMFGGCSNLTNLTFGSLFITTESTNVADAFKNCSNLKSIVFTDDIPVSIHSRFFSGIGTANAPANLLVPDEYHENYATKFNGNMFYGGYFKLSGDKEPEELQLSATFTVEDAIDDVLVVNGIMKTSVIYTNNCSEVVKFYPVIYRSKMEDGEWSGRSNIYSGGSWTLNSGETYKTGTYGNVTDGRYKLEYGYRNADYTKEYILGSMEVEAKYYPMELKGDLTGDDEVNGMDLVALVNMIMGQQTQSAGADINGDGEMNGMDYVALVNIIMSAHSDDVTEARNAEMASYNIIGIEPFDICAGQSREMVITLKNPGMMVTMVQMDMTLPKGLRLSGGYELGHTTPQVHQLYMGGSEQKQRLLLASMQNGVLTASEGGIIRLKVTADNSFEGGDIVLSNVLCASPELQLARQLQYVLHLNSTTGISNIEPSMLNVQRYFNLSGQRLKAPHKGVNIINRQKIINK